MDKEKSGRIAIENAVSPGRFVNVDATKYNDMRQAILAVLRPGGHAMTPADLKLAVLPLLSAQLYPGGEKAGWWLKAVQLDLEAKGVLTRETSNPVRVYRMDGTKR